jgi:2-polyprenyl-3-methyl-5-hydroxy-6-metoxy-1,4-benzoquinol methylase
MRTVLRKLRQAAKLSIAAGKRLATNLLPYSPIPGGRDLLEQQYARYVLHAMWSLNELPRFGIVTAYCRFFRDGGSILDIGCGEGMLQERLCSTSYSRYLGVDISQEAVNRALARATERVSFVREDAAVFTPDERFDVIIFNECIYYFDDPVAVARHYEQFLNEDGIFIISMFVGDTARTRKVWKMLDRVYRIRAASRVTTKPGFTWIVKVYSPK